MAVQSERQELEELRRLSELEQREAAGQRQTTPQGSQIDLNKLTDPTEVEFVKGRRGQMPEQDIEESIRQYRAIKQADEEKPTLGSTRPLPKTSVLTPKDELEQIRSTHGEEAAQAYKTRMTQRGELPEPPPERTQLPQEPRSPSIPAQPQGPAKKSFWEPRVTWEDLKGSTGQSALAAGLATAALSPGPLAIPGFIAGATSAILADEGTRRLQEEYGEVPGALIGTGLSTVAGGAAGMAGRTKPMGPFTNVTPPEPTIPPVKPPATGLYETVPKGGAYSSTELLTEPSTRISPEHQFSTGSGKSLFGEGQIPFTYQDQPVSPLVGEKLKGRGRLQEKYPTIQEQPIPEGQLANEAAVREAGKPKPPIDLGGTTPDGKTYIPPREYREAPDPSGWRRWWNIQKQKWGQELPVLKTHPNSPVISAVEATHVAVEDAIESLSRQPWLKSVMKLGDNKKMAELEAKWVSDFQAGRDWQSGVPKDIRTMMEHRATMLAEENAIRRRRGLPEIHETPGPYLPRMTDDDFKLERVIGRMQGGAKTSSSVGPFQEGRVHGTMKEGMKEAVSYVDWRKAMLLREARGQILRATDQMMTDLEQGGVLFRTKEAAERASLTGRAYPADGLPFKPTDGTWWVRSPEERQFLLQNLRQFDNMSEMRTWINQYIRNPSLVNPWPHIVKNMGLKQMQQAWSAPGSMLNPAAVLKNTFAYRQVQAEATQHAGGVLNPRTWLNQIPKHLYPKGADMLEEFQEVMPFTESGRTVWELMSRVGPRSMAEKIAGTPGTLNKFAQQKIFAEWDPAMRYGLWREYVKKGMSPQEAANHTWIDLIRYGTRADRIDAWNARPFNFFVPWRVGTLRTMNKAIQSAPVRFGLFMGAVDTLREWDYRQNGRWTHLPYDYIERPLMTLLNEGPAEAAGVALTTLVFGPGGDYALRTVKNLIDTVEGTGGLGTVKSVGWGLAQVYDLWPQWEAFQKDGNTQHIVDMFGLALLGRHGTPYGAPPRLMQELGESIIPYAPEVKRAKRTGDALKKRGGIKEQQKIERDFRRYNLPMQPTIPPAGD